MLNLGFVINPLAGIGGSVALKGSDGEDIIAEALRRGAVPRAQSRAQVCLELLRAYRDDLHFYTAGGVMGADLLSALGFAHTIVYQAPAVTRAEDTERAVKAIQACAPGLIVFAGGDGTARNVCNILGEDTPVLGIPAGVKIHSSVYAVSPQAAGQILQDVIERKILELASAQVMDLDEEAYRRGDVKARLFGYMKAPAHPLVQQNKVAMRGAEPEAVAEIADYIANSMQAGCLYLLGSGSTCAKIKETLHIDGSLLGIDVVLDGQLLARDVTAVQLMEWLGRHEQVKLIVTVIGGQGHLFGRGNQQLSPAVLRRIGRTNIIIVATTGKLQSLQQRPLLIDSGDAELDREFAGPVVVTTGYQTEVVYTLNG